MAEQSYQNKLRQLKQQMPDLAQQDEVMIADPTEDHPFTLPPAQRMDPLDITIEQVACGRRALAAKRRNVDITLPRNSTGIKMKRITKQVGSKWFCYTKEEKELFVLNEGKTLNAYVTCYDSLAIFGVSRNDRKQMNAKVNEMVINSGLKGVVQKWDEDATEHTMFVKKDKMSQFFNAEREKINELPKKMVLTAKVCIRFTGIMKIDGQLKPIVRLWQVKLEGKEEEINQEPCMFE